MPILVGTDGERKMSKSLGNQIGVTDAPEEMYGKTMAIPDEAIAEYRRLLLGPASTGRAHARRVRRRRVGPRRQARARARAGRVAALEPEAASEAERHFDGCTSQREAPEEIEEASFDARRRACCTCPA